jgi:hypothetical protein
MAYQRKTKDVVCRKCGKPNRVPIKSPISGLVCARRQKDGFRCFGNFRLDKSK